MSNSNNIFTALSIHFHSCFVHLQYINDVDTLYDRIMKHTGWVILWSLMMLLCPSLYSYSQTPLKATLANGLYFVQVAAQGDTHNGKYLVDNFQGTLMYDTPLSFQNYVRMPATQWVVVQDSMKNKTDVPTVTIYNREYRNPLFKGQLYMNDNKNYFIVDTTYKSEASKDGLFSANSMMSVKDTLAFTPITDLQAYQSDNGYMYVDSSECINDQFVLKYITTNLLGYDSEDFYATVYNGVVTVRSTATSTTSVQLIPVGTVNSFGYPSSTEKTVTSSVATLQPLKRQAYIIRRGDSNNLYMVSHYDKTSQSYTYRFTTPSYIDGQTFKIAAFYLKNDQYVADSVKDFVSFIDLIGPDSLSLATKTAKPIYSHFYSSNESSLVKSVGEMLRYINPEDGQSFASNGWRRVNLNTDAELTATSLSNLPATISSAFKLALSKHPSYKTIGASSNGSKNLDIYRTIGVGGMTKEYLYEDANNASNVKATPYMKGFGYLGITGEAISPLGKGNTTAFYVDSVFHSRKLMPQYLLFVDHQKVASGYWCLTGEHGYNYSESHRIAYPQLSYGRALVNLNDSIATVKDSVVTIQPNALSYAYRGYVRLGFVDAIHVSVSGNTANNAFGFLGNGEWLVTLNGVTLDQLKAVSGVINPDSLESAMKQGKATANVLDGYHQNYAFSFRYFDDAAENVLIESQSLQGGAYPECTKEASWVKIQNDVPVLAQQFNQYNVFHESFSTTQMNSEDITQGQVFQTVKTSDIATPIEKVSATNVQLFTSKGSVTVQNASGKKLIISNILGQILVNTIVSSDRSTFAVPAGIIIAVVEGEPSMKGIVP